jgi:hypothetical protein
MHRTFQQTTKDELKGQWDEISDTCWLSRSFHQAVLDKALEVIPKKNVVVYFQVIGQSDKNLNEIRLGNLPGLSKDIIRNHFQERRTLEACCSVDGGV